MDSRAFATIVAKHAICIENTPDCHRENGNPYRLVSLWTMVTLNAAKYYSLALSLEHMAAELDRLIAESSKKESLSFDVFGDMFQRISSDCKALDLVVSQARVNRAIDDATHFPLTLGRMHEAVTQIQSTIQDELSTKLFLYMPTRKREWYESENLFGLTVADRFPSTSFEIAESGKCIALGRFTAGVFHLMRVLELGLTVLAVRFNVPSDHTNWHNIIEGIEKAVRNMGNDPSRSADWKDEQEFYSQAASHFMLLKDAWRNYTAHARGKYIEEEAETIMLNVRGFMQTLATRLHE